VPTFVSAGYEGRDVDALVAELRAFGVTVVADVRLNAVSRKPGFSKRALRDHLERAGIAYLHLPALGNPRDNRDALRAGNAAAHDRFRDLLRRPDARAALDELARLGQDRVVALLCYEADAGTCHRSVVLDALGVS
jgi:uncharacterized protein (DUF488 family)